jgi:hypothetical protein
MLFITNPFVADTTEPVTAAVAVKLVEVTEVKPASVVELLPKLIAVVPTVTAELVS